MKVVEDLRDLYGKHVFDLGALYGDSIGRADPASVVSNAVHVRHHRVRVVQPEDDRLQPDVGRHRRQGRCAHPDHCQQVR